MSVVTDRQQEEFITLARGLSAQVWNGIQRMKTLQAQWNAEDYSNTLTNFSGGNEGLTMGNIASAVFDTTNAIDTLFSAGHATNLTRLL